MFSVLSDEPAIFVPKWLIRAAASRRPPHHISSPHKPNLAISLMPAFVALGLRTVKHFEIARYRLALVILPGLAIISRFPDLSISLNCSDRGNTNNGRQARLSRNHF